VRRVQRAPAARGRRRRGARRGEALSRRRHGGRRLHPPVDRTDLRREARADRSRVRDRPRPRSVQLNERDLFEVETAADGPSGALPLTAEFLRDRPSGDVFGLTQNAGMGWEPAKTGRDPFLILSTQGGVRADDGTPVALGYHTGHWEVGLLVREAALELDRLGG